MRESTERPITVTQGTNTIVGTDATAIRKAYREVMEVGGKAGRQPEHWDGHAAERIATVLARCFASGRAA